MPSSRRPPQQPLNWSHDPESLLSQVKASIEASKKVHRAVAALPPDECNFASVFRALALSESILEGTTEPLLFYQNVATSQQIRDAANQAEILLRDFHVDAEMDIGVFRAKAHAKANLDAQKATLTGEETRLVEKMILEGKRAGLALPEKDRAILVEKKKLESQKCLEFSRNYNEENSVIAFTLDELDGVPQDVIAGYTKHANADLYDVTYKGPDMLPVTKFATKPETRKRMVIGSESRLAVNVPILEEIVELRRDIAKILGYPTWADYVTETKMVKNADNVFKFLNDLQSRLAPVGQNDRKCLLKVKKEECRKRGLPFENDLYLWDYRYYDRLFTEQTLDLDDSLVKEYFPVDVVVPTILDIYQELLGVKFERLDGAGWHTDVQQFTVWNAQPTVEDAFIGFCYLDLFPREAKYPHAAVWQLVSGYDLAPGTRSYPVAAMVANLAKPTKERPALMTHSDVVTFFHEMGHAFHGLLSKTEFGRFHGTSVARDFVEAPSQMLENWCWEPQVLERMSSHYKTREPMPAALIDKIIKSRFVNVGLYYLRQLFFAKFDMQLHTGERHDSTKLYNAMRREISLVSGPEKPAPGQGSFGHLTGGYDAGYYGYTYSLVFAADMYDQIFRKDPLSQASGRRYRDKILLPGGSQDEMNSLEGFLGRKPTMDAFLKELFGPEVAPKGNL